MPHFSYLAQPKLVTPSYNVFIGMGGIAGSRFAVFQPYSVPVFQRQLPGPLLTLTLPLSKPLGQFQFSFLGESGAQYIVEISPDLRNWTPVLNVTGTATSAVVTDPDPATQPRRFYRLRSPP